MNESTSNCRLNQSETLFSCFAEEPPYCGSTAWLVINLCTTTLTILGNILTISAILLTRKLSSVIANQFVFSLAVSDLLVGLSIPYHMSFYMISHFGNDRMNCLLRFVLISFACSSSIMNLLYIAADRYVAIVYPLHYNKFVTRKTSAILIVIGWMVSFAVAAVPLVWNDWHEGIQCELVEVLPSNYLNFVVCPMFISIWVMMLLLYSRICREANGQARRMRNASSVQSILAFRDSKSFQVMMTILGCFTICWLPYFVITLYARSRKESTSALLYEIAFNLAVANSGMNPLIYAWKNTNFRKAFFRIARCRSPNSPHSGQFVTNHAPSRKNSISLNGISNSLCRIESEGTIEQVTCGVSNYTNINGLERTNGKLNNAQLVVPNHIPNIIRENSSTLNLNRNSNTACKNDGFKPDKTTGSDLCAFENSNAPITMFYNELLDRDNSIKSENDVTVKFCNKTVNVKVVGERPRSM